VAAPKETAADKLKKSKADAVAHMCMLCRQTFAASNKKDILAAHVSGKHAGKAIPDCFSTYDSAR